MIILDIAIGLMGVAVVAAAIRMGRGPSNADRAVGADLLFFAVIGLLMIFGVRLSLQFAFDLVLIATMTGFLATLSLARAVTKGRR